MNKALFLLFAVLTLFGCSPTNETLYHYKFIPALKDQSPAPAIYIAPFNILLNNPLPLDATAPVYSNLADYLKQNGYTVLPEKQITDIWDKNSTAIGGLFDPKTGRFSNDRFNKCLKLTLADLNKTDRYSYVLFPGLVIKQVELKRRTDIGEWDGVRRELPRENVFSNGWRKALVASLLVSVVTPEDKLLFQSLGGLDFVQVSAKNGRDYVLKDRENPFVNQEFVSEGVGIALHPFIKFAGYPGGQKNI